MDMSRLVEESLLEGVTFRGPSLFFPGYLYKSMIYSKGSTGGLDSGSLGSPSLRWSDALCWINWDFKFIWRASGCGIDCLRGAWNLSLVDCM